MTVWKEPIRFQWDAGNREKNWTKHRVTTAECEEVFFDPHKRTLESMLHAGREVRHVLIGQTQGNRLLFVVFTLRGDTVRVISARNLNKSERGLYEETA
ncbi:MAG: BrnT family toxin [Candidatus Omnitrophota bacterium]|nr:BrnT family toxin [Candidatus Omnitrophota bacterium]